MSVVLSVTKDMLYLRVELSSVSHTCYGIHTNITYFIIYYIHINVYFTTLIITMFYFICIYFMFQFLYNVIVDQLSAIVI